MKGLLTLVVLFLSLSASADYCSATLKDRFGGYLRSFSEFGYNQQEACREALRSCNYEKVRLEYDRNFYGAFCEVDRFSNPNPYPPRPTPRTCEYELTRANGNVVQVFRGRGYDSCDDARRQCERELRDQQRNGRMPRAYCAMSRRGGHDRDLVTKTCRVEQVDRRMGRVVRVHTGSATGRRSEDLKRQACQEAATMCARAVRNSRSSDACVARETPNDRDDDFIIHGF
ncbi:hypothetical protein [Bacteriovorax sp. Seq25_V]|uniref:hypothetical protein n=1 Tax=Bacteriovorax sp. Seq25_V TaxID=1201288 RepID=UPI000389DE54|nr:hypothetical protein [Bacteriovorax sp. Seq25_V]EQC44239.1 hypothetical protein M900_A0378 [Bacteriovorax sp. Seq25_V]